VDLADDGGKSSGEAAVGGVGGRHGRAGCVEQVRRRSRDVPCVVVVPDTKAWNGRVAAGKRGPYIFGLGEGGDTVVPRAEFILKARENCQGPK
jgi:hypothetical protein